MSSGDASGDGRSPPETGVDYASVAEQLEAIERVGHIAYGIYDHQTGRLRLSEGARDLLAVDPRGDFTPADLRQMIHPDDREDARVQFERGIAQGRPFVIEHRMTRGDGRVIWVRRETMKRVGADGSYLGYLGVMQDITEQRGAEDALRARERELSAILDNSPIAIFLKDRDRRFRVVNRRYEEWSGKSLADMVGRTDREVWGGTIAERIEQADSRVLDGEVVRTEEPAVNVAPGNPGLRHLELTKFPVRDAAGMIAGICGFVRNITDRKEAEKALHERERELTAILDNAPVAIFLKDRVGRFRLVNRRYEEWFGVAAADLVGRTDRDIYDDGFATMVETSDHKVLAGAVVSDERPALKVAPGYEAIRHISVTKFPISDAAGAVEGICGFIRDITDRKEAEEARRESEARFRALIEHSSDVISVVDPDGTVRYMSPSAQAVVGRDPATRVGQSILEFIAAEERPHLAAVLARIARTPGGREGGEARLHHPDGGIRVIAWIARNALDVPGIEGIVVNAHDVTEHRQLAEQLAQAQKMEAVGQLASGIAHDFNNIIGAILGFAGFLVEDLEPGSETHRFASRVVQAGTRAREVVQQILTFARRTGVERKPQDLRPIVAEAIDLARASLPSSTQISAAIAGAPLVAAASATQISQILLNLCMNAHDAASGDPGTIAVTLERIAPGAADALGTGGHDGAPRARLVEGTLDPGSAYARLAVADDGSGMDEAVLRRVFEPFFTTKSRGRGTGLGLPLVHGIVAAHGGVCVVESAPGRGTSFAVLIPLAATDVAAGAEPEPGGRLAGRERILVVDDDGDIVDMVTTGLDRLGYEAVGIGDAVEALAVYRADPAAWDVVISDQVMPRIKGLQLLAEMRAVNPGQHFILCTGFSDSASEQVAREAGVDGYFLKPVPIGQLAAAIRALCSEA